MENKSLKNETLESASEYCIKLISGIELCNEHIEKQKYKEALSIIPHIGEGLLWISQAAVLTETRDSENLNSEYINEQLIQINEALENTDYVQLSDILLYELKPRLEEWYKVNFSN